MSYVLFTKLIFPFNFDKLTYKKIFVLYLTLGYEKVCSNTP